MAEKERLDLLLVSRGLAPSRQRAQALILSGNVLVNDQPITKAGENVSVHSVIRIREMDHPFVSRGGVKLEKAIQDFKIPIQYRVGLDIGASTGGFTQVLLNHGAKKVFAIDVGHNQMDWMIRQDPRVVVMEKTNARSLTFEQIGEKVGVIVVDVSFISLEKIFPAAKQFATEETDWITLIKPQFEVGREKVGKGGIVQSEADQNDAVERIRRFGESLGLARMALIESPIKGTQGNREFLAHWKLVN
ncbi:MAG: TlyA family RNA methyltransferase [Bdellovibrionales bacterium]|nr:TlyA family RNA methyltransferase [Bdellovibrionales bacterium]